MSTLYGREGGGGAPGGVPPSGGAARDARGARRRGGRWVEGTDPFVVAQLFCRFEELPPAAQLPLFSLIVARNAAANGRAVNVRPPPWDVPAASLPRFTQGGRVPLAKHYVDESAAAERENYRFGFYRADRARIDGMVARAATREEGYYRDTDAWLYAALERHGGLAGREAVVMGSLEPWYESVALALGAARVTTIEYNRLQFDHPQLRSFTCAAPARARPRPPAPARARPRPPAPARARLCAAPAFAPRPPARPAANARPARRRRGVRGARPAPALRRRALDLVLRARRCALPSEPFRPWNHPRPAPFLKAPAQPGSRACPAGSAEGARRGRLFAGLGRYGDPVDPDGDLRAMARMETILRPGAPPHPADGAGRAGRGVRRGRAGAQAGRYSWRCRSARMRSSGTHTASTGARASRCSSPTGRSPPPPPPPPSRKRGARADSALRE